jgi:hypothetical protein
MHYPNYLSQVHAANKPGHLQEALLARVSNSSLLVKLWARNELLLLQIQISRCLLSCRGERLLESLFRRQVIDSLFSGYTHF